MNQLNIRFHPDREALIFDDIEEGDGFELRLREIVVVANGVNAPAGKTRPSVILRLDMPDGKSGIVLTTARLLVTAARMIEARHPGLMEDA